MTNIAMIALTELDRDGIVAGRGELFYTSPIVAAQLNYAQTARFAEPFEETAIQPPKTMEPAPAPAPSKRRRTYRRKTAIPA